MSKMNIFPIVMTFELMPDEAAAGIVQCFYEECKEWQMIDEKRQQ